MKNLLSLLVIPLLTMTNLLAQNCKYEVNEFDDFTKQYTKVTKQKQIASKWKDSAGLNFKKVGDDIFFMFTFIRVIKKKQTVQLDIKKGYKFWLLLEDGNTVEMTAIDDTKGYKDRIGIPLAYTYISKLQDVHYSISKDDLLKVIDQRITTYRFEVDNFNGRKENIDLSISNANSNDIRDLAKCML